MTHHRHYCQTAFIVQAMQYRRDNLKEVLDFTGKHPNWHNWFKSFEDYEMHVHMDGSQFKVFGNGGTVQIARISDYIIKDNTGVIYVINETAFRRLYHPV